MSYQMPDSQGMSRCSSRCSSTSTYGEIVFQGKNKTVWYAKTTDNSEDPISGIVAWFTSFGWDVEVIDLRS